MKSRFFVIFIPSILFLQGCNQINTIDDFPWPGHSRSERVQDEILRLNIISTSQAGNNSLFPVGTNVNFNAECGQAERVSRSAGTAIGTALATAAVGYVADAVNARLAEEAKKYEATWTAVRSGQFYADQRGTLAARCFRLTRSASGAAHAFDFVGQFDVSTDDSAGVRVRPLYLRYDATKARTGNSGRFSATLIVTVEAVWIERRRSGLARTARAFSAVLPFGQMSLASDPIRIGSPSDWPESTWLPAVPYSLDARGNPIGRGAYTLTATVSETATARDQAGQILGLARSGVERARQAALDAITD